MPLGHTVVGREQVLASGSYNRAEDEVRLASEEINCHKASQR